MTKWVYTFGDGKAEGEAGMRNLLGGKGANLAEMSNLGLPVPPGLTITTEVCTWYYANKESYPPELKEQVSIALREIGYLAKGNFGDPDKPLLLSVRSGARVSMPGMMDTVLNLGLNAATAEGLARLTGDERFAYDSYRRFIQMYSDVVLGVDHAAFEEILDDEKDQKGVELDTDLSASDLKRIAGLYKARVEKELEGLSPKMCRNSFGARSARCSAAGTAPAPIPIASSTTFRKTGAPPSRSRPWCSATAAKVAPPASPSPAIRRPARSCSMANS